MQHSLGNRPGFCSNFINNIKSFNKIINKNICYSHHTHHQLQWYAEAQHDLIIKQRKFFYIKDLCVSCLNNDVCNDTTFPQEGGGGDWGRKVTMLMLSIGHNVKKDVENNWGKWGVLQWGVLPIKDSHLFTQGWERLLKMWIYAYCNEI